MFLKSYAWLLTEHPPWIWGGPQPQPHVCARELAHFEDAVDGMIAHCEELRNHTGLLWTLAHENAKQTA